MFICIFAMNFGAMASGQANQFGPDIGKAKSAAMKIFSIFERPTSITAMNQVDNQKSVQIDMKNF